MERVYGDGEILYDAEARYVGGAYAHGVGILGLVVVGGVGAQFVPHEGEGGVVLPARADYQPELVLVPDVGILDR